MTANTVRSSRNKTIATPIAEGKKLLKRVVRYSPQMNKDMNSLRDVTILGDMHKVCSQLPQDSCDLIVADPPYNLTKQFGSHKFKQRSMESYEEYTRDWLSVVVPLLAPTGTMYVCCDWASSLIIGNILPEFLTVRNRITWQREKGRGAKANWKNGCEDIWFATKSDDYTFNLDAVKLRRKVIAPYRVMGQPKDWTEHSSGNFRDTCPSNFWDDITVPFWSMPENTAHPTQKPEKLIAKLILASSNKGDLVLDPFLGSGTTSVVAKKLGRHYIGIEVEEQFCLWAEQRLENAQNDGTIQGYSNGVFWERNSLSEQKLSSQAKE